MNKYYNISKILKNKNKEFQFIHTCFICNSGFKNSMYICTLDGKKICIKCLQRILRKYKKKKSQ